MEKRFNPPKKQEKKEHNKYKNESFRVECILPKQQKQKEEIQLKILSIIKEVNPSFDENIMNDMFVLTSKMGQYTEFGGEFYLGTNKAKKLNKIFQELQKLMKMMAKKGSASNNHDGITTESGSTIMFKKVRDKKVLPLSQVSQNKSQEKEEEDEDIDNVVDDWEDINLDNDIEEDNSAW